MPISHRRISSLLLLTMSLEVFAPGLSAYAFNPFQKADAPAGPDCSLSNELSLKEQTNYYMFNARLTWLDDYYGKPAFEAKLTKIVNEGWPRSKMIQVSPVYYERLQNLVDQARLKDLIARTIGLDSAAWKGFDSQMHDITLHNSIGADLNHPFDKVSINLLTAIKQTDPVSGQGLSADEKSLLQAEAIFRATNMHSFLQRWRVLNGEIIDERAEADSKEVAIFAIGVVGAGVLASTFVISGPAVGAAGAFAGSISANPIVSALLVKVAETAAGAAIGFYGAPGAQIVQDSYQALSDASKKSANNQSSMACELGKESEAWRKVAGDRLLSAALTGAAMGVAGGALTFTAASAKIVLYGTGVGVVIANLYAAGKMTQTTIQSLAMYKIAEESEDRGDHDLALTQLKQARDLAQEAGEHALETIIIGTLTNHVVTHFGHALHEGETAIRQLYAASADTIPTAERATENTIRGAMKAATGGGLSGF